MTADKGQTPIRLAAGEDVVQFVNRYGGFCRDCADEGGVCPRNGIVCADPGKAVRFVLGAVRYGVEHGYLAASAIFTDPAIATLTAELEKSQEETCDHSGRLMQSQDDYAEAMDRISTLTAQLAAAEKESEYWKRLDHIHLMQVNRLQEGLASAEERAEQGVAAGLEMAAKVADDLCMDASGFPEKEHAYGATAKAISALADQHKPSPAEETKP